MLGLVLILPVFANGGDWVLWWVRISFDLGVVYLPVRERSSRDLPATYWAHPGPLRSRDYFVRLVTHWGHWEPRRACT